MLKFALSPANLQIYKLIINVPTPAIALSPGGGIPPYKRLMGMCRWMGSHFHDWVDYNGVALSFRRGSQIFGFLR